MRFVNFNFVLVLAPVALIASSLIWFIFLRPAEQLSGNGTIVGRTFAEKKTVEKTFPSSFRNIETTSRTLRYTLPDRHVYEIRLDGRDQPVRYAMPDAEGHNLEVGQRVCVTYIERGIPLIWKKIYVQSAQPLSDGTPPGANCR